MKRSWARLVVSTAFTIMSQANTGTQQEILSAIVPPTQICCNGFTSHSWIHFCAVTKRILPDHCPAGLMLTFVSGRNPSNRWASGECPWMKLAYSQK